MTRSRKSKPRDARGYQQTSVARQPAGPPNPTVKQDAMESFPSEEARPFIMTTAIQSQLELLLEQLPVPDDDALNTTSRGEKDVTDGPSDRFTKRIGTIYDQLIGFRFTFAQIQSVVVALGYSITLESALNWLCLHLASADLPPLFTEGQIREDATKQKSSTTSSGPAITVVAPVCGNGGDCGSRERQVLDTKAFVALPPTKSQATPDREGEDNEQAQKAWLLQQYEYVEDDDDDAEQAIHEDSLIAELPSSTFVDEGRSSGSPNVSSQSTETELDAEIPTPEELVYSTLQAELSSMESDLADEASNYMRSKYEIKELQKQVKVMRQKVRGAQRKVNQQHQRVVEPVISEDTRSVQDGFPPDLREMEGGELDELFAGIFDATDKETTIQHEGAGQADPVSVVRIPSNSVPKKWTGKTPKLVLEEYCRKNKAPRPTFRPLSTNGCHLSVKPTKRPQYDVEYLGPSPSFADSQQYVAAMALYEISPELPLYRLFPPFYRDLWQGWMYSRTEEAMRALEATENERKDCIDELIQSIPDNGGVVPTLRKKSSEEVGIIDDEPETVSWDDDSADSGISSALTDTKPSKASFQLKAQFMSRVTTTAYRGMLKERSALPIFSFRDELLRTIRVNPVTVVCAETGAGKTTQCPQYILEEALLGARGDTTTILCSQPRRVAAISVAERVSDEMFEDSVGRLVGYQIRLESRRSSETRLLFCTTGVILRRLVEDPTLKGISHVIVDEVHERQWQIDVLLVSLRALLQGTRSDLKVVLMSATLDADLFRSFFGGAPLVTVPGRTFPVATYHLEDILEATNHIIEEHSRYALRQYDARETVSMWVSTKGGERKRQTVSLDSELGTNVSDRYPGFALPTRRSMDRVDESQINYDLIEDLLEFVLLKNGTTQALSPPEGVDISNGALLIFLPGVGEIKALSERLRSSRMFGDARWFTIVPLHSLLSSAEQRRAFEKPLNGRRNIILSTNIAETSVTIPDVVCVLDSGRVREVHYEKRTATRKLVATWCSKASAKQRAGRAGRVQPGLCLKLFSSLTEQNNMRLATEPEIRRIPLEEVCLNILASGFAVKCSDFLSLTPEPPDPDNVNAALQVLQNIKALTYSDSTLSERLTPLGNHLSRLPVDVRLGKMMVFGTLFRCIDTIATIVAALSASKSPFVMSLQDAHQAKAAHSSFHHPKSDFLTLLNVWEAFNKCDTQSKSRQFCQDNFLSFAVLREMGDARIQYLELLVGIGLLDRVKAGYDNQSRRFDSRLSAKSQYNRNGRKESIVHTVICAGLYPNVARVHLTPQGDQTIWHKQERLFVHSSSVNAKASRQLPICWMGYHEKFGTGNRVSISTTFFVHPLALLLFGGEIVVLHPQKKVTIDGWMELSLAAKTGVMFIQLRKQIDSILSTLIDCTDKKILESEAAESMVDGIVSLLS